MAWRDNLRLGSYRGVPFYIDNHEVEGGRRLVATQFPLIDVPFVEDLGRTGRTYRVQCYVIGDDYMQQREALRLVLESAGGDDGGRLVHPYLGEMFAACARYRMRETQRDGGIAYFDIEFLEVGRKLPPPAAGDTAASWLQKLAKLMPLLKEAFTLAYLIATKPGFLANLALGLLGDVAGQVFANLTGLDAGAFAGLVGFVTGFALSPADPAGTADNVLNGFAAIGSAAVARVTGQTSAQASAASTSSTISAAPVPPPPFVPGAPIAAGGAGSPFAAGASIPAAAPYFDAAPLAADLPADPSFGLAALASYTPPTPAPAPSTPVLAQQAANQQAIVDLVRGAAVLAIATVYAQTDWTSAGAAQAARDQLVALIDDRSVAAELAGNDQLYLAWQDVEAAAVADLTARAMQLPDLGAYAVPASLPSLALAQRLYADPTRSDELVRLNDARHPLFMAPAGKALSS